MHSVVETELVSANVRRYTEKYNNFSAHFDDIKYRLSLDPSLCERIGVKIEDVEPPTYVIETTVMRPIGIPRIVILVEVDLVIEIKSLAVYEAD